MQRNVFLQTVVGMAVGMFLARHDALRVQISGLDRFYPKFREKGVTEHKFVDLIVSDYQVSFTQSPKPTRN